MKKRILSVMLSLCMITGGLPVTALAAEEMVAAEFTAPDDGEIEDEFTAAEEEISDVFAYSDDENDSAESFSNFADKETVLSATESVIAIPDYSWYTSESNTYTISDVSDLLGFANIVNGTAGEGNPTQDTFAGKTIVLESDIDLSGVAWKPIGNLVSYPSDTFAGTFDGQGHVVSNMLTTDTTSNNATAGFFGSITGIVKNLTLTDIEVTSTHYAGGIVGYSSANIGMRIENCHVKGGTITSTPEVVNGKYDNGDKIGGIIGYCVAGDEVTGCSVEDITLRAYRDIGGIAGCSAGTINNNNVGEKVKLIQDNTNGYKESMPTTVGSIIGRNLKSTCNGNGGQAERITYVIKDTVTLALTDGGNDIANGVSTVEIVGEDDTSTLTMSGSYCGYLKANNLYVKNLTLVDEKNTSDAWEFYYIMVDADTFNASNCVFQNEGINVSSVKNSVFTGCTFSCSQSKHYSIWAGAKGIPGYENYGDIIESCSVTNCKFNGVRGIKVGAVPGTSITVSNNTFNSLSEKPALNLASPATVVMENNTYIDMTKGLYAIENGGTVTGSDTDKVKWTKEEFEGEKSEITYYGSDREIDAVAKVGELYYSSLSDAIKASNNGDEIVLLSDIDMGENSLSTTKDITLDLNGKILSGTPKVYLMSVSGKFTLCDDSQDKNGKLIANDKYALIVNGGTTSIQSGQIEAKTGVQVQTGGSLKVFGGQINASNTGISIFASAPGTVVDIYKDADIKGYYGITIMNGQSSPSMDNAPTLNVHGGTIYGKGIGISGNGTYHFTNINIIDGRIKAEDEESAGIYHPQNGKLTISGGSVEGDTGIEIRAGELEISGGTITGTGIPTSVLPNGSGTTTEGAGVAIAQHTTKLPINVTISGGNISGYSAVYESNPQKNSEDDLKKITAAINNGYFKAINGGTVPVYSEYRTGFISGGYFNSDSSSAKYLATGKVYQSTGESEYAYKVVDKPNTGSVEAEPATKAPTVEIPSDAKVEEGKKTSVETAASNVSTTGLTTEAQKKAAEVTEEDKKAAEESFKQAIGNPTEESTVKLYAQTYLKIEPKTYSDSDIVTTDGKNSSQFSLDITPMYRLVVSNAEESNEIKVIGDDKVTEDEANAIQFGKAQPLDEIGTTIIRIPLPDGFLNNSSTLIVKHEKEGKPTYYYTAKVVSETIDPVTTRYAVFTNPDGFSTFTLMASGVVVGGQSYSTLQAAVDAAQSGDTIKVMENCSDSLEVTIASDKSIKIDLSGYGISAPIINEGTLEITDSSAEKTGNITGVVTNKNNAAITGGIVSIVDSASGTVSVKGGTVSTISATGNGSRVNIYGGTVNTSLTESNGGKITVYGGKFASGINVNGYLASGYQVDSAGNVTKIPVPVLSSNNYLSALTISQGTLSPAFDRYTTVYTAEVENETESITVTPVKDSYWASIKVNGTAVTSGTASGAIALAEGENTITIRVTAENGSVKDYTVKVTRKPAPEPGEEYKKLKNASEKFQTYKKDDYTESSWTAFEMVMKEAEEALKDIRLAEEKAKELLEKLEKAAGDLEIVGTPVIKTVAVSGNQATVKIKEASEKAEGYDFVIGKSSDCIITKEYVDICKNITAASAKFSYLQKGTYYVFCHAWKKIEGKKVFGGWSEPYKFKVTATTVKAPVITGVTVKGSTVYVKVKNSTGTLGTDAVLGKSLSKDQYGKRPADYGKLVVKNKNTTTIIFKNVPKGIYYAGVHAFNRSATNNGKVFSKWSNIRKVVVK